MNFPQVHIISLTIPSLPQAAAPVADEPAAPKKENKKPFTDLPKPKMDMDTFKRFVE